MSTNWKSIVERNNAKLYTLPEGWESRETVARDLECSEDRVRVYMEPAVKAKEVETKAFPVWDRVAKRIVRTMAYRRIQPVPPKSPAPRAR